MAPKQSKASYKLEMLMKEIVFFENKIKNCEESNKATIAILQGKIKDYEDKLSSYFSDLSQYEGDENFEEYLKTKDNLLSWSIELVNKISESEVIQERSLNDNVRQNISVQLPKLEIPHFYGNKELWLSFREIFKSSILENKTLNDVEKLQYLQSCVKGDALKLIRGFPVTAENLKNCWDVLLERYENRRQLAITQINKIYNLKISKANSAKSLLELIDIANEVVRNLKTLNLPTNELSELMIINCLISKVAETVYQRWELTMENNSIPTLDEFKVFIEKEARSLDDNKTQKSEVKRTFPKPYNGIKKSTVNVNVIKPFNHNSGDSKGKGCILCQQWHSLFKCPSFNSMSLNERWKVVQEQQLCANCLRQNHKIEACKISFGCKNCQARHHTLLHEYSAPTFESASQSIVTVAQSVRKRDDNQVLLSTAKIRIKSSSGKLMTFRALLDSASQNCLISKSCAEKLNLPLKPTSHRLIGINNTYAETSLSHTTFSFSSHFSADLFTVDALVVTQVTTPLPNFNLKMQNWPHIQGLLLADPSFNIENEIDILLGADIFMSLITGSPIMGPKGTPTALPSKLGHLLSGRVDSLQNQQSSLVCHTLINLDNTLKNFWQIESIPQPIKSNDEDERCEQIFTESHTRNLEGRYVVKLPFKENSILGDSKEGALRRFYSLERKLQKDDNLKSQYVAFMEEYQNLGNMTPINTDSNTQSYFLPHHGVVNENSSTTKLRVVFDGSFNSSNGKSLNDVLLKGEKLQSDIFKTLIKFRTFPIAFSADITKMYRQILITNEDRAFQQIFWRKSPNDPLLTYQLNTVTYGTACAPFLAIRTIKQLCSDEKCRFPQAASLAQDHFYVDDFLAGADSVDSAKTLIQELLEFMASGGFELRKWSCSHPEVIAELPDALKASSFTHSFQEDYAQKILGLFWNLQEDAFQVRAVPEDNVSTKRHLLSVIARTFDPLGYVSPATIILKILLQDLWKAKLDWDDPLPTDILDRWHRFQSEINSFKEIKIPRYVHILNATKCEFHGFCDSSSKAYAAVIYLRVISEVSSVFLIASKTRVAPVQPVTLPRLELCGALLLAELMETVQNSVNFPIHDIYLWCDSTITLSWINKPPVKGNQFVQHRVGKIHSLTDKTSWHHIPGKSNPADCATRGLFPKQLKENSEWFTGPKWLYESGDSFLTSISTIPDEPCEPPTDIQSESSIECISLSTQVDVPFELLTKVSSYLKLIRIVAWIFRFRNNAKSTSKTTGPLQAKELNTAINTVVKLLQQSEFQSEIKLIKDKKPLPKSSKLISLNAFLDSEGILRVGGRLRNQQTLGFDQKYPMIIPKHHNFTSSVIRHFHKTNFHAGQELVLSLIRQTFWIPDGKSTVRKELRQCLDCFKKSAKPISQIMGNLPLERVNPCRAFLKVGVDFAGPFTTKCQHSRKASTFKSYLCLFICMCTKAVHLELVSTLSSSAFMAALRRFVSRRGYPSDIFSDNGTNFVGASAYLKSLFQLPKDPSVQDYSSQRNITWHFIPPYAPNFGGVWEASVKLAKYHLIKTCQSALLNFEELSTLLCQIEGCINSRPLYPMSPDPKDVQVLTPGHFLIGCPLLELPEHQSNNHVLSSHSRWQYLLQLKEQFWKRWTTSYLHTLQERKKWQQHHQPIQPGTLVLLKDPSSRATVWTIGRISASHPGADGVIRVVKVYTAKGEIMRAVSQLAFLPILDPVTSPRGSMLEVKE